MKNLFLALAIIIAFVAPSQARERGTGVGIGGVNNAYGIYPTTMMTSNTAAQNMTAFGDDITAALAAGDCLYIPAGDYDFGFTSSTQLTTTLTGSNKLCIRGDKGGRTLLLVQSGSNKIPWLVTSGSWTDYTVSAVATATSGADLSTESEVTKVTVSSPPSSIEQGDMFSLFSNDLIYEETSDQINYAHEISEGLDVSGSDIYLSRKLNRTYTASNYVRLRQYNNRNIVVDIDDIHFAADGDWEDEAITTSTRPQFIASFTGLRNLNIGSGVVIESSWQGGFRLQATMNAVLHAGAERILNGLSGGSVNSYIYGFDGVNLNAKVDGAHFSQGRHITSTFYEETTMSFTGASVGATTTLTYSGDSGDSTPATGDLVYVSGITGTLSAVNGAWYTITAATGSGTAGGTITFAYDSTGLAYTSGGTGKMFQPDEVSRYGDNEEMWFSNISGSFNLGDLIDSHGNGYGTRATDVKVTYPVERYGSIDPKAAQFRGVGESLDGLRLVRGTKAVDISESFSVQHNLSNYPVLSNMLLSNQQDRDAGAYINTSGNVAVTDKRQLVIDGMIVTDGATRLIQHANYAGNLFVRGLVFEGDWGTGASTSYMLNSSGGDFVAKDCYIDLTDAATNDEVRVAIAQGGRMIFDGCYIKGLSMESSYAFKIATADASIIFRNSTIEFDSAATDGTINFAQVDNVTGTITFDNVRLVNAAKLDSTLGLVNANNASGVANVSINRIIADGGWLSGSTSSGGTFNVSTRTPQCFTLNPTTVAGDVVAGAYAAADFVPADFTLTSVIASLKTNGTTDVVTVDLNELPVGSAPGAGTTVLSTKLTIDAAEPTSTTAATPAVISDREIAAYSYIIADIDTADTGNTATGLVIKACGITH